MCEEEKKAIEGLFHLAHINTYLDLEKNAVIKISRPIIERWKDETKILLNLIDKQQKEIERLKDDGIGDTKFDKLLFSIRMLHFHHYINDTQFEKMIMKLSNEGE